MLPNALVSEYGADAVSRLATAYEETLLAMSDGEMVRMPDRRTRLAIVAAMLAEGRQDGFATDRLKRAGMEAATVLTRTPAE